MAELTHAGPGTEWKSWGANGRITFTAILTGDDEDAAPAAMARLLPPIEGMSLAGRDSRLAELVLYVGAASARWDNRASGEPGRLARPAGPGPRRA